MTFDTIQFVVKVQEFLQDQGLGSGYSVPFAVAEGPRLNSINAGVEIWPSATANGTE